MVSEMCRKLSSEIVGKFGLDPLDLQFHKAVAAAQSRDLTFLDATCRSMLKAEVLSRCSAITSGNGCVEVVPEPAAKCQSHTIDLFFGARAEEDTSTSIQRLILFFC